jgi:hypothetical protein
MVRSDEFIVRCVVRLLNKSNQPDGTDITNTHNTDDPRLFSNGLLVILRLESCRVKPECKGRRVRVKNDNTLPLLDFLHLCGFMRPLADRSLQAYTRSFTQGEANW